MNAQLLSIIRKRVAQIERDKAIRVDAHRLWLENRDNNGERVQIVVTQADHDLIPARNYRQSVLVTDLLTGRVLRIRRASCGLPGCLCALVEVQS